MSAIAGLVGGHVAALAFSRQIFGSATVTTAQLVPIWVAGPIVGAAAGAALGRLFGKK